jgi:hypothetical protein
MAIMLITSIDIMKSKFNHYTFHFLNFGLSKGCSIVSFHNITFIKGPLIFIIFFFSKIEFFLVIEGLLYTFKKHSILF